MSYMHLSPSCLTSFDCLLPLYITHMGQKYRAAGSVHRQLSGSCNFTLHLTFAFVSKLNIRCVKTQPEGSKAEGVGLHL